MEIVKNILKDSQGPINSSNKENTNYNNSHRKKAYPVIKSGINSNTTNIKGGPNSIPQKNL